jgi:hypothetical protein
MTEEESKKKLAEIDMQMVRLAGFQDGYKAAMEFAVKLIKDEGAIPPNGTNGTGIKADEQNT